MTSLFALIIGLVLIGLFLYLIKFIPIDPAIQKILHVVVIALVILWLIGIFFGAVEIPVPHLEVK